MTPPVWANRRLLSRAQHRAAAAWYLDVAGDGLESGAAMAVSEVPLLRAAWHRMAAELYDVLPYGGSR